MEGRIISDDQTTTVREEMPSRSERHRGYTWRSATVYKCAICHTKTNKWVIGGYPSAGPRVLCPAKRADDETLTDDEPDTTPRRIHDELAELRDRREEINTKLRQYRADSDAAQRTIERLRDEKEAISGRINTLRASVGAQFDDVVGVDPDTAAVKTYTPTIPADAINTQC